MSEHIVKRHNKNLLMYHYVCPIKYRKVIFTEEVENYLKEICQQISNGYEIYFLEIGADENHIHFLIQSVPVLSPSQIIMKTKSITARELYKKFPQIKKTLWGGHIWTSGYYVNTVGRYGNEDTIRKYVKEQGKSYKQIFKNKLPLFDLD
jgi:REP element-mobilizing transposase RayT